MNTFPLVNSSRSVPWFRAHTNQSFALPNALLDGMELQCGKHPSKLLPLSVKLKGPNSFWNRARLFRPIPQMVRITHNDPPSIQSNTPTNLTTLNSMVCLLNGVRKCTTRFPSGSSSRRGRRRSGGDCIIAIDLCCTYSHPPW